MELALKDGLARLTVSSISWFHSIRKCYPSIANCHQCKGWEHWSSGYEGRGFAFQHRILYGHFSRVFDVKNCNVCLRKRPGIALFKKLSWTLWYRNTEQVRQNQESICTYLTYYFRLRIVYFFHPLHIHIQPCHKHIYLCSRYQLGHSKQHLFTHRHTKLMYLLPTLPQTPSRTNRGRYCKHLFCGS